MQTVYARDYEISEFESILSKNEAQFVAIYGRRRIGKTYLIHEYFKDKGVYFELTGIQDASLKIQLENYATVFADTFYQGAQQPTPQSWQQAFTQLRHRLIQVPKEQKIILFFDELPWLASARSGFLDALDHFWNRYLSRMPNVILIICGSAASWMIDNIINNTGGLHGRLSKQIRMLPFNLSEAIGFLRYRDVTLNHKQFIEIYMATGGVAKYLTQVNPGKSSAQVIQELCFSRGAYLNKEFNKLYRSLFKKYDKHLKVVRALASKNMGLSRNELLAIAGLKTGGASSLVLHELEESGFIMKIPFYGKGKTESLYRLIDPYSIFYVKWIETANTSQLNHVEDDYWIKLQRSPSWSSWAGYNFENICLTHIDKIKKALGIAGVHTCASTWRHDADRKTKTQGAQIDIILDRADNCINLIEIKFHNQEYVINEEYAKKLEYKKQLFQTLSGTKKAIFITMISLYGVKENQWYHQVAQNQLIAEALFA